MILFKTLSAHPRHRQIKPDGLLAVTFLTLLVSFPVVVSGQRDNVDVAAGRAIRGTVVIGEPNVLTVDTDDGKREVPGWQVTRVRFESEPNELTRARSAYADDRYNVVIQELDSVATLPERQVIAADMMYFRAMAMAKTSLAGGNITSSQAIAALREFYEKQPNSYLLDKALLTYADLTFSQGTFSESSRMYERLAGSNSPEIAFQSRLNQGRSLLLDKQYTEAITAFQGVEAAEDAADYALQGKLIAKCLRAEAMAYSGQANEANSMILDLIKNNDARNTTLFGYAYNALGASHLQNGELKEASRSYLHTALMFKTDPNAHAKALAQLAIIWPQLDRNDRAIEARQELKDTYRNTFWAAYGESK